MPFLTIDEAWVARFDRDLMKLRNAAKDVRYSQADRVKLAEAFNVFGRRVFTAFVENFLGSADSPWVAAPVRDALFRLDEPASATSTIKSIVRGQEPTLVLRHVVASMIEDKLHWPVKNLLWVLSEAARILTATQMQRPYWWQDLHHLLNFHEDPKPWTPAEKFKNALLDVLDTLNRRGNEFRIYVPKTKKFTVDNVPVTVVGVDYGDTKDALAKFAVALREFKKNAGRVSPRALALVDRADIRLYVGPESERSPALGLISTTSDSASWEKTRTARIQAWFFPRARSEEKPFSYTIAHEVGHIIYRTWLGPKAVEAWVRTIQGDTVYIPVKTLLERWPLRDGKPVSFFQLFNELRESDPMLALQIDAFSQKDNIHEFIRMYRDRTTDAAGEITKDAFSYDWFRRDLEREEHKQIRILRVPGTPITGYANKNPEEAFCEAFAMLVTYGPRTLYPKVYQWLSTVLGADVRRGTATGRVRKQNVDASASRPQLDRAAGRTRRKGRGNTLELGSDDPAIRSKILTKADSTTGFLNCRLFAQVMTGHAPIDSLPKRTNARVGDLLQWGENPARHFAFYIGGGDVVEVEEWGQSPRVVPLSSVTEEYEAPTKILSTRELLVR